MRRMRRDGLRSAPSAWRGVLRAAVFGPGDGRRFFGISRSANRITADFGAQPGRRDAQKCKPADGISYFFRRGAHRRIRVPPEARYHHGARQSASGASAPTCRIRPECPGSDPVRRRIPLDRFFLSARLRPRRRRRGFEGGPTRVRRHDVARTRVLAVHQYRRRPAALAVPDGALAAPAPGEDGALLAQPLRHCLQQDRRRLRSRAGDEDDGAQGGRAARAAGADRVVPPVRARQLPEPPG